MLKVRVIPTLLTDGLGLIKGEGFESWRTVGALVPAIRVYNRRDVDELLILDVAARREGRSCDPALIEDLAAEVRVPLTVGGGLSNRADISRALSSGADKVVLNSAALDDPSLITRAADTFGSQAIVVSIDAIPGPGGFTCVAESGRRAVLRSPHEWAREAEERGAGELIVTSVRRDGTMTGYDLELIRAVSDGTTVPVVAGGGAGSHQDLVDAVKVGGASAVAVGAMFQFTQVTPHDAREFMAEQGIHVRRAAGDS